MTDKSTANPTTGTSIVTLKETIMAATVLSEEIGNAMRTLAYIADPAKGFASAYVTQAQNAIKEIVLGEKVLPAIQIKAYEYAQNLKIEVPAPKGVPNPTLAINIGGTTTKQSIEKLADTVNNAREFTTPIENALKMIAVMADPSSESPFAAGIRFEARQALESIRDLAQTKEAKEKAVAVLGALDKGLPTVKTVWEPATAIARPGNPTQVIKLDGKTPAPMKRI